jgi:hypothetical protein
MHVLKLGVLLLMCGAVGPVTAQQAPGLGSGTSAHSDSEGQSHVATSSSDTLDGLRARNALLTEQNAVLAKKVALLEKKVKLLEDRLRTVEGTP